MAALSQTLKAGLVCKIIQQGSSQSSRALAISATTCKPNSGTGKKSTSSANFIALPRNVEEINESAKVKFSPKRTRDSSSARIEAKVNPSPTCFSRDFMGSQGSKISNKLNSKSRPSDSHIDVYDANSSVSLSSVMQSTVPQPYKIQGKKAPAHLNMPGGQWAQGDKYVSGDLHAHHCKNISRKYPGALNPGVSAWVVQRRAPLQTKLISQCGIHTSTADGGETGKEEEKVQLTQRQRLKRAVKEYGATVIVFHVSISLASLGVCYLLVSSGIDMSGLVDKLGINLANLEHQTFDSASSLPSDSSPPSDSIHPTDSQQATLIESSPKRGSEKVKAVAAGVSTFVLSYAIHKVFAPLRIAVTLTSTPFIVRHLRKIGVLKPPKGAAGG